MVFDKISTSIDGSFRLLLSRLQNLPYLCSVLGCIKDGCIFSSIVSVLADWVSTTIIQSLEHFDLLWYSWLLTIARIGPLVKSFLDCAACTQNHNDIILTCDMHQHSNSIPGSDLLSEMCSDPQAEDTPFSRLVWNTKVHYRRPETHIPNFITKLKQLHIGSDWPLQLCCSVYRFQLHTRVRKFQKNFVWYRETRPISQCRTWIKLICSPVFWEWLWICSVVMSRRCRKIRLSVMRRARRIDENGIPRTAYHILLYYMLSSYASQGRCSWFIRIKFAGAKKQAINFPDEADRYQDG